MNKFAVHLLAIGLLAASCTGDETRPPATSPLPSGPAISSPTRAAGSPSSSADLTDIRFGLREVASFDGPVVAMAVRKGDPALYVAEKDGRLRAIRNGRVEETPALDLSEQVSTGGEQGLLGVAFSPDGSLVYVNFTDLDGNTHVVEFRMSGARADPSSRREVMFVRQPYSNHNGGNLVFGPDGYLYIGLGDGGSGGDPHDNGQSLRVLLGKMLRIDPRPGGGRPYTIPPDNPFVSRSGARPEIWAYGLRNPWRYSFDRRNGDLWIGDVGQGSREEIDFQPAGTGGQNYGWNRMEGTEPYQGEAPADAVAPIFDYGRDRGGTVIGGFVYRGESIPDLQGVYVFADFYTDRLKALRTSRGRAARYGIIGPQVQSVTSFGEDAAGELYVLTYGGVVYKVVPD